MTQHTTLYLIRHGATPANESRPRILQGSGVDESLSQTGQKQAELVAEYLSAFPIDAIFSSPLKRAGETAQAIAARHGLTVATVEEIREVNVGRWERMDWASIEREFPEQYQLYVQDPATYGYFGGECTKEVVARTSPAFDELLRANVGRTIAVVAHSVVNRTWLTTLLGLDLNESTSVPQDNCCINVIEHDGQRTRLVTLNSTLHMQNLSQGGSA